MGASGGPAAWTRAGDTGGALPKVRTHSSIQRAPILQPGHFGRWLTLSLTVQLHLLVLQDIVLLCAARAPDLGGHCYRGCSEAPGARGGSGRLLRGVEVGGARCPPTQYGHHKVLAGLRLGILGHARVGARLGWLQATQLQASTSGDDALGRATLCGTEGQNRPSLAWAPWTKRPGDSWARFSSPIFTNP